MCFKPLVREKCYAALVSIAVGCVVGSVAERFGQEDIILFFAFGPVRRGQNNRNKNVSRTTSVRFRGGKDNDLLQQRRHTDVGLSEAASTGRTRNTHTHNTYAFTHSRARTDTHTRTTDRLRNGKVHQHTHTDTCALARTGDQVNDSKTRTAKTNGIRRRRPFVRPEIRPRVRVSVWLCVACVRAR